MLYFLWHLFFPFFLLAASSIFGLTEINKQNENKINKNKPPYLQSNLNIKKKSDSRNASVSSVVYNDKDELNLSKVMDTIVLADGSPLTFHVFNMECVNRV